MTDINKLKEKLTAQLPLKVKSAIDMANNGQTQKDFNNEMVSKTWKYQKK